MTIPGRPPISRRSSRGFVKGVSVDISGALSAGLNTGVLEEVCRHTEPAGASSGQDSPISIFSFLLQVMYNYTRYPLLSRVVLLIPKPSTEVYFHISIVAEFKLASNLPELGEVLFPDRLVLWPLHQCHRQTSPDLSL